MAKVEVQPPLTPRQCRISELCPGDLFEHGNGQYVVLEDPDKLEYPHLQLATMRVVQFQDDSLVMRLAKGSRVFVTLEQE